MINKRCFLQSFLICLSYAVAAFFAWSSGLFDAIWNADRTYMTSVIGIIFVLMSGYIAFASWRFNRIDSRTLAVSAKLWVDAANADIGLGHTAAYLVTLVGVLGTALGLMGQVSAMSGNDLSSSAHMIIGFMATALYATACGITASICISMLVANLQYFVDREGSGD